MSMIVCTHTHVGGQNVKPQRCDKRAGWEVPKIRQTTAGHVHAMQVCGVHRRFWLARGFDVKPITLHHTPRGDRGR